MGVTIFLIVTAFIIVLQSAIPYLLRNTVVFGVTIPEGHTNDPALNRFKRMYTGIILGAGVLLTGLFLIWTLNNSYSEERIILTGLAVQLCILVINMVLYFFFHGKTTKLKGENEWGTTLKQIRVADLSIRTKDEMLPSPFYLLPMVISLGLIAYTFTQYAAMPDLIPTHWGPDGQPDAFSPKTPFSVVALLLMSLVMQGMMLGIHLATKRSGIKISAVKKRTSAVQQLSFRKYTSWFLFLTTLLVTAFFSFLQLTTIHEGITSAAIMLAVPLGFLMLILIGTAFYAFKVGQGGSRIEVACEDESEPGITDVDEDRYWKAGVFYVNRQDPSVFVEKRFGVGWTMNFGNPLGYVVIFVPLVLILLIAFLA
ncbi:DUF5808 domain-containing protein [Sporosarcina sp. 179-K 3D1 HS]|uniref:DUF1648 domain-containing protein n=1 Tax=Sporosarcina sp. 179-K 3D1 HS TaxID=3232169 RepID=UPI00399F0819